jgi:hypothetical protein
MSFTAQATTGCLGQPLVNDFDLSNVFVNNSGERINIWSREVSYKFTDTLRNILSADKKYLSYNLLASILRDKEKVALSAEVSLYASGNVKEIRVDNKAYRCVGTKYYGSNKNPVLDKEDDEL